MKERTAESFGNETRPARIVLYVAVDGWARGLLSLGAQTGALLPVAIYGAACAGKMNMAKPSEPQGERLKPRGRGPIRYLLPDGWLDVAVR